MSETLYFDIRAALAARLRSLPDSPDVAWENLDYKPTVGKPYLIPALLMSEPDQVTIGTDGLNEEQGIYQITVTGVKANSGTKEQLLLAGRVKEWFKRGTILTYNGVTVTVRKTFISPPTPSNELNVSIDFYLQVAN